MKDRWDDLLTVLNKMLSIYQAILTLGQRKNKILVAAKAHDLEKLTKQEEVLILQAGKLEDLRGKLVNEIMAANGITEQSVSFGDLHKIATPEVVKELEAFSKEFGVIMTEMVPLNKLNTELIKQALGFINYNINILSQTVVGPTYAARGRASQEAPQRTVFDARV